MKKIILLLIPTAVACNFIEENHFEIDPAVLPAVDKFYREAHDHGVLLCRCDLVVTLDDDLQRAENANGITSHTTRHLKQIRLDAGLVTRVLEKRTHKDSLYIEMLVFHELGHAKLGRGHTSEYSIMSSYEKEFWKRDKVYADYQNNPEKRRQLIDELFLKFK